MDFLSNKITSIRNGEQADLQYIVRTLAKTDSYKTIYALLELLRREGIIRAFSFISGDNATINQKGKIAHAKSTKVIVYLKYDSSGKMAFRSIFRISTPGRRIYVTSPSLWQPQSSTGFSVLSTVFGLITDMEARRLNVGGELLFGVT